MKHLYSIFTKPYPLEQRISAQLKLAFIFGVVVFLSLLLINSFSSNISYNTILPNCAIAGLLTFLVIAFDFFIFFRVFPQYFTENKWTIGRELVWTLIIITTIATANILAASIFLGSGFSISNWFRMVFYTAIIGIAPATASILINQARLVNKYRQEVKEINEKIVPPATEQVTAAAENKKLTESASIHLTITSENEKDNLTIPAADFLAATSADNYIKLFYENDEKLFTVVIRTTLKKVEENCRLFPYLFRCHRTAIVNLNKVKNVSGSAQGYRLQFTTLAEEIPVSRILNQTIKEKLAAICP